MDRKTRFIIHGFIDKGEEGWLANMCKVRRVLSLGKMVRCDQRAWEGTAPANQDRHWPSDPAGLGCPGGVLDVEGGGEGLAQSERQGWQAFGGFG